MSRRKSILVPECQAAIQQMKEEFAAEFGLAVGPNKQWDSEFATELGTIPAGAMNEHYWGHLTSRDTGRVGGSITRRLVQQAEQATQFEQ